MKHYGYLLPQKDDASKDGDASEKGAASTAILDADLKAGLKKFQGYYGLQRTGKLDGPTKALITRGRCGAPDATTTKTGQLEANVAVAWGTKNLKYHLGNPSTDLPRELCWAAVRRAFDTWEAANVGLEFTPTNNPSEANIAIHWGSADDPDLGPEGMIGGTLAHADFPFGASVLKGHARDQLPLHFDDSEHVWVDGAVFNAFDIETVALHEIGHCLGMYHSNVRGAVMYPFVDDNFMLRRLQQDDKLGIRQLYGDTWTAVANAGEQTVLAQAPE